MSSLSEILSTSPLSKIVSRLTIISSSEIASAYPINVVSTSEITLAPPLLPFPLLVTLRRILYASLPKGVPSLGVLTRVFQDSINLSIEIDTSLGVVLLRS